MARQIWERIISSDIPMKWGDVNLDELAEKLIKGQLIMFLQNAFIKELLPPFFEHEMLKKLHVSKEVAFQIQSAFPLRKDLDPRKARLFKRTYV